MLVLFFFGEGSVCPADHGSVRVHMIEKGIALASGGCLGVRGDANLLIYFGL